MDSVTQDVVLDFIEERNKLKEVKKKANKKAREARKKLKELDKNIIEVVQDYGFPVELPGYLIRIEDKLHARLKKPTKVNRREFVEDATKMGLFEFLDVYTSGLKKMYPDISDNDLEVIEEYIDLYTTDDLKVQGINND